jgi:hypothetical protein
MRSESLEARDLASASLPFPSFPSSPLNAVIEVGVIRRLAVQFETTESSSKSHLSSPGSCLSTMCNGTGKERTYQPGSSLQPQLQHIAEWPEVDVYRIRHRANPGSAGTSYPLHFAAIDCSANAAHPHARKARYPHAGGSDFRRARRRASPAATRSVARGSEWLYNRVPETPRHSSNWRRVHER